MVSKPYAKVLKEAFPQATFVGFTGTPIFAANTTANHTSALFTTEQTFGDQLHTYTIVDAINDKNVLPFRVDYIKTMDTEEDMQLSYLHTNYMRMV